MHPLFSESLFIIAMIWRQPGHPSINEKIKEVDTQTHIPQNITLAIFENMDRYRGYYSQ